MNWWKCTIEDSDGTVWYSAFGYETEEEAEEEGKSILEIKDCVIGWPKDVFVKTSQVWQETEYKQATPVVIFDSELQESRPAVVSGEVILCCDRGSVFELGEMEITREFDSWIDFQKFLDGNKRQVGAMLYAVILVYGFDDIVEPHFFESQGDAEEYMRADYRKNVELQEILGNQDVIAQSYCNKDQAVLYLSNGDVMCWKIKEI